MTLLSLIRSALLGATLMALSGCAAISALGGAATPLDVFELRAPDTIPQAGRTLARDVVVELPTTGGALATDRIMIRPDPLQAQFLPGARWSQPAPDMVQTLMLRTLDATGGFRFVGRNPLGAGGDYAIVSELVDFQAELTGEGESAAVRMTLIARVVREEDARIVASRRFASSAVVNSTETAPLIRGFDAASDRLMTDFAGWALGVMR